MHAPKRDDPVKQKQQTSEPTKHHTYIHVERAAPTIKGTILFYLTSSLVNSPGKGGATGRTPIKFCSQTGVVPYSRGPYASVTPTYIYLLYFKNNFPPDGISSHCKTLDPARRSPGVQGTSPFSRANQFGKSESQPTTGMKKAFRGDTLVFAVSHGGSSKSTKYSKYGNQERTNVSLGGRYISTLLSSFKRRNHPPAHRISILRSVPPC